MPASPRSALTTVRAKLKRTMAARRVRRRFRHGVWANLGISGRYLVTTELGPFLVAPDAIHPLTDWPDFGVARQAERFFAGRDLSPRGIAWSRREVLIGHSHKGERSKRFAGTGGLAVATDGDEPSLHEIPWAQTYDILALDAAGPRVSARQLRQAMRARFGTELDHGPSFWEPAGAQAAPQPITSSARGSVSWP
jgi:hypothetical protein